MSSNDESRDTAALNKTFEDLVLEIEELERLEREKSGAEHEQPEKFLKVYYVTGCREDPHRASYEDFAQELEGCKNLCDLRKTHELRSESADKPGQPVFVTPKFETQEREVGPAEQAYCSLSELKVNRSECILDDCLQIARQIHQDYQQFKAFVLLAAFEDMDFLATGVSLLMRNLNKIVIFTGGHHSIGLPNSDSNSNLVTSLMLASSSD
jgi:Asparaginase, N-terminal